MKDKMEKGKGRGVFVFHGSLEAEDSYGKNEFLEW